MARHTSTNWRYNNVKFKYSNPVDSVSNQSVTVPYITTYKKSKYALMQALEMHIKQSYLGPYAELDQRSVTYDPPVKI